MSGGWTVPDVGGILALGVGGPLLGLALARRAGWGPWLAAGLGLAAVGLALAGQPGSAWLPPAALALGYVAGRTVAGRGERFAGVAGLQAALYAGGGPLLAVVLAWRAVSAAPAAGADEPPPADEAVHDGSGQYILYTDLGRGVPVRPPHVSLVSEETVARYERSRAARFPDAVMTAGPDPSYNCHGWIFADGSLWIEDDGVELILYDNGYQVVDPPREGDLAIYRDELGRACHSGIVREVSGANVRVESKWGSMQRFVHAVDQQPFGKRWEYYRTERSTHRLRVVE